MRRLAASRRCVDSIILLHQRFPFLTNLSWKPLMVEKWMLEENYLTSKKLFTSFLPHTVGEKLLEVSHSSWYRQDDLKEISWPRISFQFLCCCVCGFQTRAHTSSIRKENSTPLLVWNWFVSTSTFKGCFVLLRILDGDGAQVSLFLELCLNDSHSIPQVLVLASNGAGNPEMEDRK